MGDFFCPKRRDVVDRLRKRIENYRRHHYGRAGGYENNYNGLGEQYRQDNLLPVLHQRWRENRAKKAAKSSKANKDTCNTQNEHRNLIVTQKLKKKIDSTLPEQSTGGGNSSTSADNVFNFDEQDSPQPPTSQSLGNEKNIPRLSVQIVQKINQQQEYSQTIQTNVTVSSTLKHFSQNSPQSGGNPNSNSTSIHTSVECKQEPVDEPQCRLYPQGGPQTQQGQQQQQQANPAANPQAGQNPQTQDSSKSNASSDIAFDDHNLDELALILNNLEKVEGDPPADILKELDKFHEICVKVQRNSDCNESGNMYSPLSSTSPGLGKGSFPDNMPPRGPLNSVFEGNQNVNNVTNSIANMHGPPSAPIADSTGPAASTLKQMAAQHQHQQNTPFVMKSTTMDPFVDPLSENFSRRPDFPNYSQHQSFGNMPQGQNSFPFNQQNQSFQHMPGKPDLGLTYGGTKPLTHFADPSSQGSQPPSSLQQLQNQVRSQFNQSPNPQMQITQTQQMQVSQGQQRFHLSQTQQLQMQQAPQQISMSQQQSFTMQGHMNQNQSPMMNEQMNMQMMQEKMRHDQSRQQQQQQQRQQQMQQERQQQMRQRQGQQMMDAQQSQYMNRPPPEYKMQQGTPPATFTQNGGGSLNPLQTMQNMVDQTGGYGVVKSEVPTPQPQNGTSMMQMSAMQQSMSASVSGNAQTTQATRAAGYMVQHMQRPPSYPNAGQTGPQGPSRPPQQTSTSTYTSAILRNQRPPNVNVGPDGLNISQPRTHEWPRPMMPPTGPRPPMGGQTTITQQSAAMMQQYSQYPNSTQGMPQPAGMHMQRPDMSGMQNQNSMMPNGNTQVMMQQQSMQIAQHGVIRGAQPGSYNMPNPAPMSSSNTAQGGFPPSSTQDDFMNFLDNAQNSNSDIFDSMVQNSGTPDFNLLDEILGK